MSTIVPLPGSSRQRQPIAIVLARDEDIDIRHLVDPSVYVTIGPGETHVVIMDDQGLRSRRWTAVFGWSFLFDQPIDVSGRSTRLEEEETLAMVLSGRARIFGHDVDTSMWCRTSGAILTAAIDEILHRTIGSGAMFRAIVLDAPEWLHGLLSDAVSLRPHILKSPPDC